MPLTTEDYKLAIRQGHEVALALAIKRFRDEYRWTEQQVRSIGQALIDRIDARVQEEIDRIADDITRMEDHGRPKSSLKCTIIASMALIGAQVCESFELSQRAGRN